MIKISIEVGHGGVDSGAVTKGNKVFEKDIALDVALELKRQLTRQNIDVLISRTTDINDRAADFLPKVRAYKPDLGLSIHFNAFNGKASGFECYYRNSGFATAHVAKSKQACNSILTQVKSLGYPMHGEPVKQSEFLMQNIDAPSVYLEGLFIDNPSDYQRLDTLAERKALGTAYAKGIFNYLGITWVDEKLKATDVNANEKKKETEQISANTPFKLTKIYLVTVGAYTDSAEAAKSRDELIRNGYESSVSEIIV